MQRVGEELVGARDRELARLYRSYEVEQVLERRLTRRELGQDLEHRALLLERVAAHVVLAVA